ncbi:MAG: LPXTG cell wall anchor domain-containing protein [Propionibacteriales bacterium]|nr:LPXTG cell wall anchor domain-containing protein [Propionibacteriales bacterium]
MLLSTLTPSGAFADDVDVPDSSESAPAAEPEPAPEPDPEPAPEPEPEPEPEPAPASPQDNGPGAGQDDATGSDEDQDEEAAPPKPGQPDGPQSAAGPLVVSGNSAIVVEATSAAGADVPIEFSISGAWSDGPVIVGACAISDVYVDTIAEFGQLDFLGYTFGTSFSVTEELPVGSYHGACLWAPFTLANIFKFKFHRFTVEVTDPLPTVSVPSDLEEVAVDATGVGVDFTVSGNDVIDGVLPVTCTVPDDVPVASGDTFPIGVTTVTCEATNSRDVVASDSFDVTVTAPLPSVTVPDDLVLEATGPTGAPAAFSVSGSDFVGTALEPTCRLWDGGPGAEVSSGATFPLGTTEVSCNVEDSWGGEAADNFLVSVVDTTGPVLTLPDDITVEATGPDGAAVEFEVSATDLVVGPVPVTCSSESGTTFPIGTTEVTCAAVDGIILLRNARAVETSGSFTVTVTEAGDVGGAEEGVGGQGGDSVPQALPDTGAPSLTGPLLLAGLLLAAGGALVLRRRV